MKRPFWVNPGVYGILTDPVCGCARMAEIMVAAGLKIIQLRMKDCPESEVIRTGHEVRRVIPEDVCFIMNDDPRIAVEVGADGVHLGQDDMGYAQAREIMGPDAVIGLSTHNADQMTAACRLNPDYVGVGPVFETPTRKIADPTLGLETMKTMVDMATVPAVCLGGINIGNAGAVVAAGAPIVCAVRCINQAADPAAKLEALLAVVRENSRA